ncbi:hypothetical protein OUZ56_030808 [Daphnia magna]|uniref:Glutamine amidotransferase domain-containing protein n=1 Tax=Daphnia magna TaxID=35525 RepID=A0ABQ9ZSD1_9CRUS|nr:hypothetical protein OUZ56_030808 [Daphnia magna]
MVLIVNNNKQHVTAPGYRKVLTQCTRLMPHYTTQQYLSCGFPVLGICYGKQILNKELGETVERKDVRDGQFEIRVETECSLFKGLETWQMKREQQCNDYIRRTVGRDKIVLMLVSGGVYSAVCDGPTLLHKALLKGDDSSRVQAIHIDNGFLRRSESYDWQKFSNYVVLSHLKLDHLATSYFHLKLWIGLLLTTKERILFNQSRQDIYPKSHNVLSTNQTELE